MKETPSATILRNAKSAEPTIRKGIEENLSLRQIANLLESSPTCVKRWASSLEIDIPRKRIRQSKDKRLEAFHEMRRMGCTLQEIGRAHGVTREYVRQMLSRWYPDEVFPSHTRKHTICKTCNSQFHGHATKQYCSIRCRNLDKGKNPMSRDMALTIMGLRDQDMTWNQVNDKLRISKNGASFRAWLQRQLHFFSAEELLKYFPGHGEKRCSTIPDVPKSFIRRLLEKFSD